MISTATMDDSCSITKMHSTISFCVLKEEKAEDISEEDFQAIKEEINDVDENDVNIRKLDESPVCEEDRSPREKVIEKNSNKTLNMNIEDDNAIYIMAGGEVDTNNENAVSDKFKSLGEKTDTFMCEDGDPLASSMPCVAEARRKKKSSLTAKRTRKKGDKEVNRNRKEAKEKHFTCEICPKKFSFKSEILLHMRVHTKEKPFSCEICSKSFTKKSTLLQHARIHTHEKPFSCKLCNKKFSQKGNLDTHTRFHTTEKPYSCRICSMAFSVKSQLVCHIRVHTKEKPFICDVCNKFFTWKSDLDRHLRVHTKVKPFTCGICDKSFAWKSDLKRHLRVHTKETPYICLCKLLGLMVNFCSVWYLESRNLLSPSQFGSHWARSIHGNMSVFIKSFLSKRTSQVKSDSSSSSFPQFEGVPQSSMFNTTLFLAVDDIVSSSTARSPGITIYYGSHIYSSASTSLLAHLDTIHHYGLRLTLGAFRSSPTFGDGSRTLTGGSGMITGYSQDHTDHSNFASPHFGRSKTKGYYHGLSLCPLHARIVVVGSALTNCARRDFRDRTCRKLATDSARLPVIMGVHSSNCTRQKTSRMDMPLLGICNHCHIYHKLPKLGALTQTLTSSLCFSIRSSTSGLESFYEILQTIFLLNPWTNTYFKMGLLDIKISVRVTATTIMEDLSSDMKKQDSTIEFIAVKEEKFEDTSEEDFQRVKEEYNKDVDEENTVFIKAEDEANRISECTMSEEIRNPRKEGDKNEDNSEEDFQGVEEYNKDLDEENTVFIKAEDEANMLYECTTSEEIKSPGKKVKDEYNSEEDFQGVKEDYNKDIYKENTVFIKAEDEANMISEEIKCPGEEGVKNDSDFCVYKDEDPLLLPTQDVAGDCRKLCPLDGDQTIHKEDKEVTHKNKNKEAKVKHFTCEVCGRKYRCKSRLVAHIRVHTKEKPFSCKVCNKSFLRKDYVVEHMKVHSSEKPYACEVCSKDFSRKGHLVKHIKGVHMKEKPYLCEICSKVFSVKSDLSVHMRVHTNEKPYSCKLCSKVFTVRSNLVRHMRSHTKEKPYSCEVCSKSFFRKDYLVEHMRVHTNEKPFTCELCNKSFSEKGNLVRHMRVHTGEIS
ncbi:zinc finger protein 585A [Penaeus vannamei]|uniref:zinc finger protein 585A n=1 Tax=Penaeus vannamei TaxID=6689 RepID=UPI00387F8994